MGDFSTKNAGGVTFSELHGSSFADIDGDGIPGFRHRKALLVAPRHVHRSRSARAAGPLRLPNRAESEGARRRRVRPGVDPQPLGNRIHGGARRSRTKTARSTSSRQPSAARSSSGTTGGRARRRDPARGDEGSCMVSARRCRAGSSAHAERSAPEFVAELLQAGLVDPCGLKWRERHALGRIELRHDHQLVARALERFHDGLHVHLALTERAIS